MARWTFEPAHTAAAFRARHMMVTYVRGALKNVHGTLVFDAKNPRLSSVEATIDAGGIWTGEPQRDAHLRSPDFFDVEHYPQIIYKGEHVELIGDHDYVVTGELTIRGVTRSVSLRVRYLGQWQTPWWEKKDGAWMDKGPKLRAGFVATTEINRHDFGVRWNEIMDKGGVVVGDTVSIFAAFGSAGRASMSGAGHATPVDGRTISVTLFAPTSIRMTRTKADLSQVWRSRKLSQEPLQRRAVSPGAARWRHVSRGERSQALRKAARARWARHRPSRHTRSRTPSSGVAI